MWSLMGTHVVLPTWSLMGTHVYPRHIIARPGMARVNVLPHSLTVEEAKQVDKIIKLLDELEHSTTTTCIFSSKPDWVTFTGRIPFTGIKLRRQEDAGQTLYRYHINFLAFRSFMKGGYWYNMGCTDLKNFFYWVSWYVATAERQRALKANMDFIHGYSCGFYRTTFYPILVRLFFNYASAHENMAALNMAFHKYVWVPTWPIFSVLLLGANSGKQMGTGCRLARLPPDCLRFIVKKL